MTNLITAQEAFTAIHNGKTVLCRFAGNRALPADKDFSTLDQVSAMVFVWPDYEFCIQVEMMELAGITFTKPLTPQDVVDGQEIFIVMPTKILRTQFDVEHDDIRHSVMNGFAQADKENATLQLQAMCAVFGTVIDFIHVVDGFGNPKKLHTQDQAVNDDSSIDDIIGPAGGQTPASFDVEKKTSETKLDDKPKQKRLTKKEKELQGHFDLIIDSIRTSITDTEVLTVVYQLESYGFNQDQLQEIESAKSAKLAELEQIKIEAETQSTALLENAVVQPASTDSPEVETSDDVTPDPDALFSNMLSSIKVATSETEVFTIRRSFRTNGSFTDDQLKELEEACEARLTDLSLDEFDTQPAPEAKTDMFANAKQSALNAAANFNQTEYESKLADLIQHAKNAKTPAEANALIRYARNWTPEQTEPLKKAIHARLLQLDKTLIERIREAQSPAILNTFLTDIQALTNAVHAHQCMTAYEQRKQQLTEQA